jgi:hypothetical protein
MACEMIREVYCDLWAMDEPHIPLPLPQSSFPTQSLQFPPLAPKTREQSILQVRRGSDRRFPQLGIKSGSMKNLQVDPPSLPQTERGHSPEGVSKNESYLLHQFMNNVSEDKSLKGGESEDGDRQEEEENENEGEEQEEEPGDDLEVDDEEEEEEDDEDISVIGTITEWTDRLTYERMLSARDYVLYTFECLVTVCENRLELQDRIAANCPYFFQALYGKEPYISSSLS